MGVEPSTPWRGWLPVVVLPAAVMVLTPADWPRWVYMALLCGGMFCGLKWLTWRRTPAPHTSWRRHLGYFFAWPGLDADAFLNGAPPPRPALVEWLDALLKLLAGGVILAVIVPWLPPEDELLCGWVGMIGLVFALHCGLFHLLSCGWRTAGVPARRLMNAPLLADSVSDFWGRRWNTAFRDLTHRFLFRPLTARLGPRGALVVGFLFSGLVHELAISVPAGAGHGGPTLFFALQAAALLLERSRLGQRLGLGHGLRGWLFAALVLVGPAGLLFHPPFVRTVVLPLLHALGVMR